MQNEYVLTYISPSTLRDGMNRNLSVSLTGSSAVVQSQYNPGGVLPEVAGQNWMLFGGILLVLLILLAVPLLLGLGVRSMSRGSKKGRVRFAGQPSSTPQKGHVKLK